MDFIKPGSEGEENVSPELNEERDNTVDVESADENVSAAFSDVPSKREEVVYEHLDVIPDAEEIGELDGSHLYDEETAGALVAMMFAKTHEEVEQYDPTKESEKPGDNYTPEAPTATYEPEQVVVETKKKKKHTGLKIFIAVALVVIAAGFILPELFPIIHIGGGGIGDQQQSEAPFEISFYETDEGVIIDGAYGKKSHVTIPDTINGKRVVGIAANAFSNNSSIVSIGLPDSVKEIGAGAFCYCENLESVSMRGVERISTDAFRGCSSLRLVTLPDSLQSISSGAFADCTSLYTIRIPASVTVIDWYLFDNCYNLTVECEAYSKPEGWDDSWSHGVGQVIWGVGGVQFTYSASTYNNTASIHGFEGGDGVEILNIPSKIDGYTVTEIREAAFAGSGFVEVRIPSTVSVIGDRAFYGMESLERVTFNEGVSYIGESAFRSCHRLRTVELPKSIRVVSDFAFCECNSLATAFIPSTVESLGTYVFDNNSLHINVEKGANYESWGDWHNGGIVEYDYVRPTSAADFEYSFVGRTATIDRYVGSAAVVSIPESIDGFTVAYIGPSAFNYNTTLRELVMPDSILEIGDSAFYGCTGLYEIEFSSMLSSIGHSAFYGCRSIARLSLPESLNAIGGSSFAECSAIETVSFPHGLSEISESSFSGCTSIKALTLPEGVTEIPDRAFKNCTSLASFEVHNGVSYIGEGAFEGCESLVNISLPGSLRTLGGYCFSGCVSLRRVVLPIGLINVGPRILDSASDAEIYSEYASISAGWDSDFNRCLGTTLPVRWGYLPTDSSDFTYDYADNSLVITKYIGSDTEVIVPSYIGEEPVRMIGVNAFTDTDVVSVHLPDTLTKIYGEAFMNCSSLSEVYIPESVVEIGNHAFDYCVELESVRLPANLALIDEYSFYGCSSLAELTLPEELKTVSKYAFSGCTALRDVKLPAGLLELGQCAFENCTSLRVVVLPLGINTVESAVFSGCSELVILCEEESMPSGYDAAFNYGAVSVIWGYRSTPTEYFSYSQTDGEITITGMSCDDEAIYIPMYIDGYPVTKIGNSAFGYSDHMKWIHIPSSITSIGDEAFANCSSLVGIEIPEGVTEIPDGAFSGCTSLKSVILPNSLVGINYSAFYGCSSLDGIAFPSGLNTIGSSAFQDCASLSSVVIPSSVSTVGGLAFVGCSSLQVYCEGEYGTANFYTDWVDDPSSVVWGYTDAASDFAYRIYNGGYGDEVIITGYNGSATVVEIPYVIAGLLVREIGESAFMNNKTVEQIILPAGLKRIGTSAFHGAERLTELVIPSGVTEIGESAFAFCNAMRAVSLPASLESLGEHAFLNCMSLETVEIPERVTEIKDGTFSYCESLRSALIPCGVTYIGTSAFAECYDLTSITIPSGVTHIGGLAFMNCTSLEYLLIPESVAVIENFAFQGDFNLSLFLEHTEAPVGFAENWNTDNIPVTWGYEPISLGELYYGEVEGGYEITGYSGYDIGSVLFIPATIGEVPVVSLGSSLFSGEAGVETVIIPEGVRNIGAHAFSGAASLKKIVFPSSLRSIGVAAFASCPSLESIILPDGIESIGASAFSSCSSLESVTIPASVTDLGQDTWKYDMAFSDCASLYSIEVDAENTVFTSVDGVLYSADGATLYLYPAGKIDENFYISGDVTEIRDYAFAGVRHLVNVYIPSTLVTMGEAVFENCPRVNVYCEHSSDPGWDEGWQGDAAVYWGATF